MSMRREPNCEGRVSTMLEENFEIDRLKVDVLVLQIKVVKIFPNFLLALRLVLLLGRLSVTYMMFITERLGM